MKDVSANSKDKIYIGLGTNLGDREQNLQIALKELSNFSKITKSSSIHETRPVGYKNQNDFLNMVIEIETDLSPTELIIRLQEVEHKMGRVKIIKNGPRIIDLDILLYGKKKIYEPNLIIPHPRMYKREFVLKPLAEIAPASPPQAGEREQGEESSLKTSEVLSRSELTK